MRVTNSMMMSSFLNNINGNMSLLEKYQQQLSTGKKINQLSDDPIGIMSLLDAKSKLRKLDMQNTSIGDAQSWIDQTDTSLQELNNVIEQVYNKTLGAANGTLTGDDRNAVAQFVEQMRQQAIQIGNSSYGGKYIFGGYNTTSEPFQVDGSGTLQYDGVDLATAPAATTDALKAQVITYSTGTNISTDVSVTGVDVMGTGANNLNKILSDLETALTGGAGTDVLSDFAGKLQDKQGNVLALLADVGGRSNRLQMMTNENSDNEINYTQVESNVEDADQALATMNFKMAETVYRSALQVGAMVIQPSLLDFLK